MTENDYMKGKNLMGEWIVLQTLDFKINHCQLLIVQLDAQDQQGGRLRYPDAHTEQVPHRGHVARLPILASEAESGRGDRHVHSEEDVGW